ncbi:MAG: ABC transporter ATP-binding protein [Candidatus Diapherotrites archaeon]|nr:ABC transporter ATP-binding protein [Candidatus Diapherotrites archaeon]
MYAIKTENLTKKYGDFVAVNSLNLNVKKGKIFGFLGPNGAGKTTTILMLLGIIKPTSGKAYINDIDVWENPVEVKRITGYLPTEPGLYQTMTARDNLLFFSRLYGIPKNESEERVRELLELVGLEDVAKKKVGEFSTGMKKRLAIAQALINDPEVLFLDEPTSGLDPTGVIEMRNLIRNLKKEGKTIFFSSHILSEVEEVCDTFGIISKGKLLAVGSKEELKRELMKEKVKILVETVEPLPELIVEGTVKRISENKALICTQKDVRKEIFRQLKGFTVLSLSLVEPTLEEVFMNLVYGGENNDSGNR